MGRSLRLPWLASDSANFTPVFIEIESPAKRWFTQAEVPTSDLTQAINQLAQWRAWLNQNANVAVFYDAFEVPEALRRHLTFRPEFVLIYGRRSEFDERPQLRRLREQFERHGQVVMTFDRLEPRSDCQQYLTATKRNGRYRALAVPPTVRLGPLPAEDFSRIDRIPEAVEASPWMTPERRTFLIERLPYWTHWARHEPRGTLHGQDFLGE
jgi:hypothetical protein